MTVFDVGEKIFDCEGSIFFAELQFDGSEIRCEFHFGRRHFWRPFCWKLNAFHRQIDDIGRDIMKQFVRHGENSGMIAADIRSEWSVTLAGFCLGILLGGLLCWLPNGMVWAPVFAVLCRIPPLAAEKLQKRFEKSPGRD